MNQNLTELVFILDRSGSMHGLETDTVGGFNSMIEQQRGKDGDVFVSTVLFNTVSEVLYDRVKLEDVTEMTEAQYQVGGCTALLDAVGGAIHHIGNVHKYARSEDVPAHTLFVITTDGMENASRSYSYETVRTMIERQKERYGWEFLFLGANIDAAAEAGRLGIARDRAVRFHADKRGMARNFEGVADAVCELRMRGEIRKNWKDAIEQDFESRDSDR